MGGRQKQTVTSTLGLVDAATRLEAEVQAFEKLTQVAARLELDSHQSLEAATTAVDDAAQSHQRFGEALRALIDAVSAARDRQAASADALNARSQVIADRRARFEALRERFGALGETARAINALMQNAQRSRHEATDGAEVLAGIDAASGRMHEAIEHARALADDAKRDGMTDLQRQADGLRQQLSAARNRLEQFAQRLRS